MKKRFLCIFAIIALILGIAGITVACGDKPNTVDYSVTVVSPDEDPVSGVTVSWMSGTKTAGKAQTDEDGLAKASLPVGSYRVELSGYGEGYSYTPVTVSSSAREIEMQLTVRKVTYTVTVTDKSGSPAANVDVTWTKSNGAEGGKATTNASGKASKELPYGSYTVSLSTSTLPAGNKSGGNQQVTGKNPSATFKLVSSEGDKTYSVTVRSEGGLLFAKRYNAAGELVNSNSLKLMACPGTSLDYTNYIDTDFTDENGTFTFTAAPATYTVFVILVPDGYTYTPVTLTDSKLEDEIVLHSEVIKSDPAATTRYTVGDIIHDYTFTTPYEVDGEVWSKSISDLFKEGKKAVIINNWGINCSWCMKEMPYMEEAYKEFQKDIEIIAVNNYSYFPDSDDAIRSWSTSTNEGGFSFPMMRDTYIEIPDPSDSSKKLGTYNLAYRFGLGGWPTTVVIDRYGAIAHIDADAILSVAAWRRLIEPFIADDYKQTFIPGVLGESVNTARPKPDLDELGIGEDHYEKLGEALNNESTFTAAGAEVTWYPEDGVGSEYAWPFLYGSPADAGVSGETDEQIAYVSSSHMDNSIAMLYANIRVNKGWVLTFDYYADTEAYYDVLSVLWDGRLIREISGNSNGWQTCYLYFELLDADMSGDHVLSFVYLKDSNDDGFDGQDIVCIKDVRFVASSVLESMNEPIDMLRSAGYGVITQEGHFSYYANVELKDDGYYHVILDDLEGSELAGNDKSPLLLVNLLKPTPWHADYGLVELMGGLDENGEYKYNTEFTINGVKRDYREDLYAYCEAAQASYVQYCVPVDAFLHDLLIAFMKEVSGEYTHEKEWLEVCYYYSHYGTGDPIGNPILGVMDKTAIEIKLNASGNSGRIKADLTRDIMPFPIVRYKFTPDKAGVYKFESFIAKSDANDYAAQMWLYDAGCSDLDHGFLYDGSFRKRFKNENDQNFVGYYYLETEHVYYLAVALQPSMLTIGQYEFEITFEGTSTKELAPAAGDVYTMILDDDGNMIGEELTGAVNYKLNEADGYYYVLNADNTLGSKLYLDTKYPSTSMLFVSLSFLLDQSVTDLDISSDPLYGYFDFTKCIAYISSWDADGDEVVRAQVVDVSSAGSQFKDYTGLLREAFTKSYEDTNAKDGLIPITQEIATALSLFFSMRVNPIYCASYQPAVVADAIKKVAAGDDWLRFCWYYKTHDAKNP